MSATGYSTLTGAAGLLDWSSWGVVEAAGADRTTFLHNLLSNNITSVTTGGSCRAALLTPAAKMIAEVAVIAAADRHWLLTPRACLPALLSTLNRYLITEDVTLADRTDAWTLLGIQGPQTPEIVARLPGILRADYSLTGGPGVVLMAPADDAAALRSQLITLGAPPVSWETAHVCRIEAGVPWWGLDMEETTLLPETGLEQQLASFTKGCYVGQEIVARVDTYGSLSRKLAKLVCLPHPVGRGDGTTVPERGDAIQRDGQPIGAVTSACFSPSMSRPVVLGYVKRPHYADETSVHIVHGNRLLPAKCQTLNAV